jgi:transposase
MDRRSEAPRRIEVISGPDRRRRWTGAEKARITAESFTPGETVAGVARRHGMRLGLLYHWRRGVRQETTPAQVSFVPVLPSPAEGAGQAVAGRRGVGSSIEIELAGARIRLEGAVDGAVLRCVIAALRGAA